MKYSLANFLKNDNICISCNHDQLYINIGAGSNLESIDDMDE